MAAADEKAQNSASIDAKIRTYGTEVFMHARLSLDCDLLAKAQSYTGLLEKSELVRAALKALIERESARRVARLGGSELTLSSMPGAPINLPSPEQCPNPPQF